MADQKATPAIFDAWLERQLDAATRVWARTVSQMVGEFTKAGGAYTSSRFYVHRGELAGEAFEKGIDAALAECKRAKRITDINHDTLRQITE